MSLKLYKIQFITLLFLCTFLGSQAQNRTIDSLQTLIKTDKPDTTKVNHLILLCDEMLANEGGAKARLVASDILKLSNSLIVDGKKRWLKGMGIAYFLEGDSYAAEYNHSEALKSYSAALEIKQQLQDQKGIADVKTHTGLVYYNQNKYNEAEKEFYGALQLYIDLDFKRGIAACYNDLGNVYFLLTNYSEAETNYYEALKIAENTEDVELLARCYINLGNIGFYRKEYKKSLENFNKALENRKFSNDKRSISLCYNNIGEVNMQLGKESVAEENYQMALSIAEEINDKQLLATVYNNLGTIYVKQKRYAEAKENFNASITIRKQIEDRYGEAAAYINLASIELNFNLISDASNHVLQALTIGKEIGALDILMDSYKTLSVIDSMNSNWHAAYRNNLLYASYKDSIFNEEGRQQSIRAKTKYENEKQKQEQLIKDAVTASEKKRRELTLTLVIIVLVLVFIVAVLLLRNLRLTSKQKVIIEEKNKDIIDSINYAKRIQEALLKEKDFMNKYLPEHFIFFKPKDIVSGDFYWSIKKQDYWYLAVADSTGHGVPGAFMSMLGIAFLNEITTTAEILTPAEILNLLREKIVKELDQNENDNKNRDGFDISLVRFNNTTKELQWSGANNPLYLIKNNSLMEIKPNKQPIGFHIAMQPFTNHTFQLDFNTEFYLFTDGYADQFGGTKDKKYLYKRFKQLLITIQPNSLEKQKNILEEEFENWKGKQEQVDDVCVIGIRI